MTRRALVLGLALALLATAPLAGCLARSQEASGPAAQAAGAPPAPFADARDAATAAAREWNPSARLVMAFASEGLPVDLEDPPFLFDTRADAIVGDGRALVWTYLYAANGTEAVFYAAIDGAGRVLYANDLARHHYYPYHHVEPVASPSPDGRPVRREPMAVPDDVIGSVEAAAALAASDAAAEWTAQHPVHAARLMLVQDAEGPAWLVERFTSTGFGLHARVDAVSGSVDRVQRFPDDWYGPCESCPTPEPPPPPEKPADQRVTKTARLDAFNSRGTLEVALDGWGFAADLLFTADVPGSTPLDARRLVVYDGMGMIVGEARGTGLLEVRGKADHYSGNYYRAEISSPDLPPLAEQDVELTADVVYGEFLGWDWGMMDGGGGTVSTRQVMDHPIRVEPEAASFVLRASFESYGPLPWDATWAVLDPDGQVVRDGTVSRDGKTTLEAVFEAPTPGSWTFRVTGGDTAVFGTYYQYAAVRSFPPYEASKA